MKMNTSLNEVIRDIAITPHWELETLGQHFVIENLWCDTAESFSDSIVFISTIVGMVYTDLLDI